ncbi:MAG: HIT family protein [Patescibacteria group bacterium]
MDCPFCDLDLTRTRILKEGALAYVCLSNPRLMSGHLLVIPKRHLEKLSETTEAERKEIMELLIEFEEKTLKHIAPGCDIRQNYRPFIPQGRVKVSHLHFHLHPREANDPLHKKTQISDLWEDLSQEEIEKSSQLLSINPEG